MTAQTLEAPPPPAGEETSSRTTVYKYAVVKGDLPPAVVEEMRRAHDLRNTLVEIEKAHQARVQEVWAAHPEIAAANQELAAAEQTVQDAMAAASAERQRTRKKTVARETSAAATAARKTRAAAKAEVKRLKTLLYPVIKPALQDAREARNAAVKATYPQYVQAGLYWASINQVKRNHDTAVKRVAADWQAGRPAELRFHRWDGSGTIAVQLQRESTDPPRTPELIASGEGKWRNTVQLTPWVSPQEWATRTGYRAKRPEGRLTIRIGSGEHAEHVTIPVVMHRPMPAEADIAAVLLTRQRVAGSWEASVSFVVKVPAPEPRTEGTLTAMHMGWRSRGDGSIRVGVAVGTPPAPLTAPGLDDWLHRHDGWAEIILPASWRDGWERLEKIQSTRDTATDTLRTHLAAQLAEHPWLREAIDPDQTLSRWRSPARFAALALRARDADTPDGADPAVWAQIVIHLEAWRKQDKHLWTWEAHSRRNLVARRREAYRVIAAWLLKDAAVVVVDDWDVRQISRVPRADQDDDGQATAARVNRTLASPGLLRDAVVTAAPAAGIHVVKGTAASTHHDCGGALDHDERAKGVMVECQACRRMVDQDVSAARNLADLARAGAVT